MPAPASVKAIAPVVEDVGTTPAVDPAAEGGRFYGPDGFGEMRGFPTEVQPIASATNEETARRLWEVSEELTGVAWTF